MSELAGAAAEMRSAERRHQALVMEAGECGARMRSLREHVLGRDLHRWADAFLAALHGPGPPEPAGRP